MKIEFELPESWVPHLARLCEEYAHTEDCTIEEARQDLILAMIDKACEEWWDISLPKISWGNDECQS